MAPEAKSNTEPDRFIPASCRISFFDSTGLAIQDIATARVVFEKARKSEGISAVDWL